MEERSETVALATRTLIAAGYSVFGAHRQPRHIELPCDQTTRLGAKVPLLIAITDDPGFDTEQVAQIAHAAEIQGRSPVLVCADGAEGQLSLEEFLNILGGPVPPWHVLSPAFANHLVTTSRNELPSGLTGEAWRLFEELVADGLEFCFGRRVRRMGGNYRGKKVSDMIAALPDFDVIVVDAKASDSGFDLTWGSVRPLVEYVEKQKRRQVGGGAVIAALLVSSGFQQGEAAIAKIVDEFLGQTRTPLCLMVAEILGHLVTEMLQRPDVRTAVQWKMLLTTGLITRRDVDAQIAAATQERCELREL